MSANSSSFCLFNSVNVSNKSAFKSLLILLLKTCSSLSGDFANFRDWTACIASVDKTLDLHMGFFTFLNPQVIVNVDTGGKLNWGLQIWEFWRKPIWDERNLSEPINYIEVWEREEEEEGRRFETANRKEEVLLRV